jgi:hypothetical protein
LVREGWRMDRHCHGAVKMVGGQRRPIVKSIDSGVRGVAQR